MTSTIKIRAAKKDDADFSAPLIYLSLGHLADHLFQQNQDIIISMIAKLFTRNGGRFGYQQTFIAELEGEPIGLLIVSRGDRIERLNLATIPHLIAVLGLIKAIGFIRRGVNLPGGKEAENDELYIGNLAILPSMQGRSFGSQLIAYAEELARENNLPKCSLIAGGYNTGARRLYERNGYQIVEAVKDEKENLGYYRLIKVL